MDFGQALIHLRSRRKVKRAGWNGKGMWLMLVPASDWQAHDGRSHITGYRTLPFIAMKTAQDELVPWLCSQTDMLALDWELHLDETS